MFCAGWRRNTASAFTTLEDVEPDRQLLSLFPARILLKEELLPLQRVNGTVEVATSRLFATQGLDALKTMTGLNLKPVLASSEAIQREMKKRLGVGADTIGTLDEENGLQVVDEDAEEHTISTKAAEDEASIIRFVNQVLKDAIELRASDIHLEPFEDEFRIRYRIDGVLQEVPVPAQLKRFQPAIVSRVKILSHLNIAEKRLPQDGRIKIRIDDSRGGHPRFRHSHAARRSGRACVCCGRTPRCAAWLSSGMDHARTGAFQARPATAARNHSGHRPDRQRQNLHALHRAERDQRRRAARSSRLKTRSNISSRASIKFRSTKNPA